MNQARLNQLFEFLKEEPNDPFNLYAIATEYSNFDKEKSLEYFEILIQKFSDYLPTYYHLANLYIEFERAEDAQKTYEAGIKLAAEKGENLLLRELKSAYDEFMMDY